ncbi:endoribonuclease L-PSP, partial [Cryptococcus neoformans CHC193]
DYIAPTRNMG